MRTLQCVNGNCDNRGFQFSDAPDQYPDGLCPVCKSEAVESHEVVMRGVATKAETLVYTRPAPTPEESLVYTRTTPIPIVEMEPKHVHGEKCVTDECMNAYRDYATECKEEKLMYGSVRGY